MDETKMAAENSAITIHSMIRKFFWPVTKSYQQKMMFFLIYCVFLVVPFTAEFLGQFRVGAAFIAIFMGIFLVMPWVRYFGFLKWIKKEWPSSEKMIELHEDFADSTSVFGGAARIGKIYTFFKEEQAIVPTGKIREFVPLRSRSGVVIRAMMDDGYKDVTKIAYYKDMMPELQKMLDEAGSCL